MCENNNCNCYYDTLKLIVNLQRQDSCLNQDSSCTRPFLGGNSTTSYNTRPITFYSCCNNTIWTMPYTLNGTTGTSSVFRCEAVEGCCATCRVLAPNPDATSTLPYVATNNYFTMNLEKVGCISCLDDTYVACI